MKIPAMLGCHAESESCLWKSPNTSHSPRLLFEPVLQNIRTMNISVKQVPETSSFGQIRTQAWSDFCHSSIYIKSSICIIIVFDDFIGGGRPVTQGQISACWVT